MHISRILCPVDLSVTAAHALKSAVLLARRFHAQLHVLEVVDLALPPLPMGECAPAPLSSEFRVTYLQELHEFVGSTGADVTAVQSRVVEGRTVAAILDEA